MDIDTAQILQKLIDAESRREGVDREIRNLESQKQACLKELMKGGRLSGDVKIIDQTLRDQNFQLSKTKEEIGNLRGQLATRLVEFRKRLIEEKQRELKRHLRKREGYLKRIEELELEVSRYRYLLTGIKDHRLANVNDLLPSDIANQEDSMPLDEVIGRIRLEVSEINRMDNEALLQEYLIKETKDDRHT